MLKSLFLGNMQRLFLCIVLLCILGIVIIGGYSYSVVSAALFEQVEKISLLQMQRAEEEMRDLVQRVEQTVANVTERSAIFVGASPAAAAEMNVYLDQCMDTESIGACFLRTSDGREYTYNPDAVHADLIWLQLFCSANIAGDQSLKWYNGDNENYVRRYENYFIVCTSIPEGNGTYSTLYLFVRRAMVDNVLNCLLNKNNVALIIDNGKLLAVSDKERLNEITKTTLGILFRLYETEVGFFEFQKYEERYITSHFQSPDSEFKFLTIYETREFYKESYKILGVMLLLVVIFCLLIMALYRMIKQEYIKPFSTLVEEMKHTEYDDRPGAYINVQGNGEISILVHQYNEMRSKIHMMLEDIRKQEEMKRQAEVAALRYQINPHFFYNTLSNIKLLAMSKGQSEISTTISKFANMYRYLFSNKSNFVKVGEELEFIRNYISLMSSRYDNRLNTFYLVDEILEDCRLPVFLLQPIVENAIVHGLSKKLNDKRECFLRISIKAEADMLRIEVHDDGIGIPPEKVQKILSMQETDIQEFGLGLYNTITRLKYQYGNRYQFSVDSVKNEYTKIVLRIPLETE